MFGARLNQCGLLLSAVCADHRTAGGKAASGWKVDRARDISFQLDTLTGAAGIGDRNSGQKRFCVGMKGVLEEFLLGSVFDNFSKIHHSDVSGNMLYDTQIM
jgi:hypothetical protein